MRPEGGGKPGVENVGVLGETGCVQLGFRVRVRSEGGRTSWRACRLWSNGTAPHTQASPLVFLPLNGCSSYREALSRRLHRFRFDHRGAPRNCLSPHRYPMSPPNCREIGQSRFSPSQLKYCCAWRSGKNWTVTFADDFQCRLGQRGHFHEPLVAQIRLDRRLAAVAVANLRFVRLVFSSGPRRLQIGDDFFAGGVCASCRRMGRPLSLIVPSGLRMLMMSIGIRLALVPLPDGIVVGIVGRRHLHHAGAEFRIDQNVIGDDGNFPARSAADPPILPIAQFQRGIFANARPRRCRPAWFPGASVATDHACLSVPTIG